MLFGRTVLGFVGSALLVSTVALPACAPAPPDQFWASTTKGIHLYLATPRLPGLMVMELAVSAACATVYVNTVVLVQARFGLGDSQMALTFAAFGAGSMLAAFLLPHVLNRMDDRPVMLAGAAGMIAAVALTPLMPGLVSLMILWALIGFGFAFSQNPNGRILNRSAHAVDRPAVFAARLALSHAAWLVTYPLTGWIGKTCGLPQAALGLVALGAVAMTEVRQPRATGPTAYALRDRQAMATARAGSRSIRQPLTTA